ncbi:MAG: hypothetical protein ABW061_02055 [Polyangiaceae bacterium]
MGMFSTIFGRKPSAGERFANLTAPTPGKPTYVDAVSGHVAVDFYAHDNVEELAGNFLTAVTEGLARSRQRELALTLRLSNGEDPLPKMKDIVRFVATVHAWAREGNLVDEGGFTQFGERGLFGRAHGGLLYADARPIGGVKLPERALAAILVDEAEARTARDFGTYRVLTRIGLQLRVFPFPIWGELDRPSSVTVRESESQLSKLARLRAPGVYFVMTDKTLRVIVPSDRANLMGLMKGLMALPTGAPFALLLCPAPKANAVLAWSPGQEGMSGISPDGSDGSQLTGSCLLVVPAGTSDQIQQVEDGYSLRFSSESWARLSDALVGQRPLSLSMHDGMRLEIVWPPKPESEMPPR